MVALTGDWYAGRLERDFAPPSRAELQARLSRVGLTDPFWRLAG